MQYHYAWSTSPGHAITSTMFICGVVVIAVVVVVEVVVVVVIVTVIIIHVEALVDWPFSRELLSFSVRSRKSVGNAGSTTLTTLILPITVLINLFGYFINLFG